MILILILLYLFYLFDIKMDWVLRISVSFILIVSFALLLIITCYLTYLGSWKGILLCAFSIATYFNPCSSFYEKKLGTLIILNGNYKCFDGLFKWAEYIS